MRLRPDPAIGVVQILGGIMIEPVTARLVIALATVATGIFLVNRRAP